MGKDEFVKEITNIEEDFAQWYTDIVIKAELADYTDTKGCIAIRPYGYAIWENIRNYVDKKFKEVGVQNVYFPELKYCTDNAAMIGSLAYFMIKDGLGLADLSLTAKPTVAL